MLLRVAHARRDHRRHPARARPEGAARDDARVHDLLRLRGRSRRPGRRARRPVRHGAAEMAASPLASRELCCERYPAACGCDAGLCSRPAPGASARAGGPTRAAWRPGTATSPDMRHAPVRLEPRAARGAPAVPADDGVWSRLFDHDGVQLASAAALRLGAQRARWSSSWPTCCPQRRRGKVASGQVLVDFEGAQLGSSRAYLHWYNAAQPDLVAREVRPHHSGGRRLLDGAQRPGQRRLPGAPGGDQSRRAPYASDLIAQRRRGPRAARAGGVAAQRLAISRAERAVPDRARVSPRRNRACCTSATTASRRCTTTSSTTSDWVPGGRNTSKSQVRRRDERRAGSAHQAVHLRQAATSHFNARAGYSHT